MQSLNERNDILYERATGYIMAGVFALMWAAPWLFGESIVSGTLVSILFELMLLIGVMVVAWGVFASRFDSPSFGCLTLGMALLYLAGIGYGFYMSSGSYWFPFVAFFLTARQAAFLLSVRDVWEARRIAIKPVYEFTILMIVFAVLYNAPLPRLGYSEEFAAGLDISGFRAQNLTATGLVYFLALGLAPFPRFHEWLYGERDW